MRVLLALCVVAVSAGAEWAKVPAARHSCFERCKQEMKACYRINDVIYIDHCDRQYEQCLTACARA